MTASETTIDVVGNNLANANTVGFKASTASFVTQFLQTMSIGSTPTATSGGTNPSQTGLGVVVAATTANFSQGTIQTSSNDLDMAIEGEGFFIVATDSGERLYTRDGEFTLNSTNELVTASGNFVEGYGIDANYNIKTSTLEPINIPLGNKSVAQATTEAVLEGTLSASGTVATAGTILQTSILDDASVAQPDATISSTTLNINGAAAAAGSTTGSGTLADGTYYYKVALVNGDQTNYSEDTTGASTSTTAEVVVSTFSNVSVSGAQDSATISGLSNVLSTDSYYNIYRSDDGGTTYYRVATSVKNTTSPPATFSWIDTGYTQDLTKAAPATTSLSGQYTYYVSFYNDVTKAESRPVEVDEKTYGATAYLSQIPTDDTSDWTGWKVYRSVTTANDSNLYLVSYIEGDVATSDVDPDTGDPTGYTTGYYFIDSQTDATINVNDTLTFHGPSISGSTLAKNIVLHTTTDQYETLFTVGSTFAFTPIKGGVTLETQKLAITGNTTVQDLLDFMSGTMGIRTDCNDYAGASISTDSRIQFTGNYGTNNALEIDLSGMQQIISGQTTTIDMAFTSAQTATGESAMTDFIAYDSLGTELNVHITAVLVATSSSATTWRWYADTPDNNTVSGDTEISCGTGLITFDGSGNFLSASNSTVTIYRSGSAALSPETFNFDFSNISGLSSSNSTLAVSSQDGSSAGTLTSYLIGTDGIITGVFSNGVTRTLGQVVLARFANNNGLVQEGDNLYAAGVNSGLPILGTPGLNGFGGITSGAIEQSNTDIGGNLIDLILASTMYRANARVISTTQTMFDELLNLRSS
jgi:flagellar hook protein FlgE